MTRIPSMMRAHAALIVVLVAIDQLTKFWARARFSLPDGSPDYFDFIPVVGEWVRFRLVYNDGAAFGLQPQGVLPFLHPVVFFTVFTLAAIALFAVYYRRLGPGEKPARHGIALILAGAFGNLIDRLAMHKVTDFIDVGIPGVYPRFPVFNVADSAVTVGLILLLFAPLFTRKKAPESPAEGPPAQDPPAHG
jgi:signal peptidase II